MDHKFDIFGKMLFELVSPQLSRPVKLDERRNILRQKANYIAFNFIQREWSCSETLKVTKNRVRSYSCCNPWKVRAFSVHFAFSAGKEVKAATVCIILHLILPQMDFKSLPVCETALRIIEIFQYLLMVKNILSSFLTVVDNSFLNVSQIWTDSFVQNNGFLLQEINSSTFLSSTLLLQCQLQEYWHWTLLNIKAQ